MIKNGKEYKIVDMDNDPEWPVYCSYPHCLADIGYTGLEELTYPDSPEHPFGVYGMPTRKFYCLHCLPKMFTEDEIKILNDERREQIRREIEDRRRNGGHYRRTSGPVQLQTNP